MVTKITTLLEFLESIGASPKKSLSQNFLVDQNILRKIVEVSDVKEGDLVLEIGAGPGALTETLLNKGCQVIAVEKDDKFAAALKRFEKAKVFHGDIFDFDFNTIKNAKVVANLPYQLTSPIMGLLFSHWEKFTSLTIMVQEEVARRMVAKPNSRDFSAFTLFVNFYSTPRYDFGVSNQCFFPVPKVQSAIVTLELRKTLPYHDPEGFFSFFKKGFSQRRKMLRGTLKEERAEEALKDMGKTGLERPENLSLMEWITLYEKSLYLRRCRSSSPI